MSTADTVTQSGEQLAPPDIQWNGDFMGRDTNRVALQWGFERIPRLIELGYRHTHGWVLVALAKRTKLNGDNKVWPVRETIAAEIGMKERSVIYALDELEAGGVISTDKVPGRYQNRYEILPEGQQHAWKPWVSCKPCNVARGAVLHYVQDDVAPGASSMLHSVQDNVAPGATEQEKRTGEREQEKENKRTAAGRQSLGRSIDQQDSGKTKAKKPAAPAKADFAFAKPATDEPSPAASSCSIIPPSPVGDATGQALDAATLLARQIADAQDGYATTLRIEMANRLAPWFREQGFPELGEGRVCTAVHSALQDQDKRHAFRDWRRREYFLPNLQRLVDGETTQRKAAAPAATNSHKSASAAPVDEAKRARMRRMFKPE